MIIYSIGIYAVYSMTTVHISGGGIRASFVAQCMNDMFEANPAFRDSIARVSGVSAGSIVAACVASDTPLLESVESLSNKAFVPRRNACTSALTVYQLWKNQRQSYYDNYLLRSAMNDLFEYKKCRFDLDIGLADSLDFQPFSYTFQKNDSIHSDVITASCSIPGLFSPVEVNNKSYVDAGTVEEFNNSSILKSFSDDTLKLHVLFSCTPWTYGHRTDANDGSFASFATGFGRVLWSSTVQQHYHELKKILGIRYIPDGRSILCMKRASTGFRCLEILSPSEMGTGIRGEPDFFVAMVAPTEDEYVGFEAATLLSPPSSRRPVIHKMMERAKIASKHVTAMVAACDLPHLRQKLDY